MIQFTKLSFFTVAILCFLFISCSNDLQDEVEALNATVSEMESKIEEMQAKIDDLESKVEEVVTRAEENESKIRYIEIENAYR